MIYFLVFTLASFLVYECSALGQCPYCETAYDHCMELFGCSNRITDTDKCYQYCYFRYNVCEETTNCKPQPAPSVDDFQKSINS